MPILVILGDKTANEVLEAAVLSDASEFSAIEKLYFDKERFWEVDVPRLAAHEEAVCFNVGIANPTIKAEVNRHCLSAGWLPFSVVHPTATIAPSATLGVGVFVAAQAVVSSNAKIGDYCIVHIHATVGHDVSIGEYSVVLPGARVSGSVIVGQRVLIGSNAFVAAGCKIGDDCQVDALTYVRCDIPDGYLASVRTLRPVKRVK